MTRRELEAFKVCWGAWYYFGILTFLDRPGLLCCDAVTYIDGKRQQL